MKTRIIIDSTADLMPEYKNRVRVVPLTVHFGEEEYTDGVTIDHETFYKKLVESTSLPSTSQATPNAFATEFEKVKAANESAVVITISSRLSGTYQSAMIAAQDYDNIYVVDSGSVTVGCSLLIERALSLLDEGYCAKAIAQRLEEEKKDIVIIALLDTLEYLKRGGRISKTVAFAGSVLNIKPILSVVDGNIQMAGKARGTKLCNSLSIQEIEKAGGIDFGKPVLLGYTGISDDLLRSYIEDTSDFWNQCPDDVRYTSIGSVIGTHAGPGAVIISFFKK